MSWTLWLYAAAGTFKEFNRMVSAVLEHHFNNHDLIGEWCKAKKQRSDRESEKLCFRCKEKNNELCLHFKKHREEFMGKEALVELHHPHGANHVEGFKKLIMQFLPKDQTYCRTIEKIR
jgi:hypothetical protein